MIKKVMVLTFVAFVVAGFAHALVDNMEVSTEVKTGIFWDTMSRPEARMHHSDDAGVNQGRFRLGMHFWYENLGIVVRFQQDTWGGTPPVLWDQAFAYGNFLTDQLRVSIGLLGYSPWSWGGGAPRWLWFPGEPDGALILDSNRLQLDDQVGIRVEVMPAFLPGLNVGFVINDWDNEMRQPTLVGGALVEPPAVTLGTLLMETVLGVSYTNDHFHGRFSLRLDSDAYEANVPDITPAIREQEGIQLMYRLEMRFLGNIVEGLSVWANGWWSGLGADHDGLTVGRNWLNVEFAPPQFIAGLGLGAKITAIDSHVFTVLPSFHFNILPFLRAGAAFRYEHNFGTDAGIRWEPVHFIAVEPQVRIHFGRTYLAFVYGFENRFDNNGNGDMSRTQRHWINLRTVVSF